MTVEKNDIQKLLDFLKLAERLKMEMRHSWLSDGRRESVAEHSWMMALFALLFEQKLEGKIDITRTLKMILIHDIAETIVGDIPYFEKSERKSSKAQDEANAMLKIKEMLPHDIGSEIVECWEEFEQGETAEAKFANALDHLEVQNQHNLAALSTWEPIEYGLVDTKMEQPCAHDRSLVLLANEIKERAKIKIRLEG